MANCTECGKKFGFLEAGTNGLCNGCAYLKNLKSGAVEEVAEVDVILLTPEKTPNLNITKRIEAASGPRSVELDVPLTFTVFLKRVVGLWFMYFLLLGFFFFTVLLTVWLPDVDHWFIGLLHHR